MKKVSEIVKPFSEIIFGALFFLTYFNFLAAQGKVLAIGIVATIISCYYLAVGIINFVLGDKLPEGLKKVFDIVSISAFPLFLFVNYLLLTIEVHQIIGPAGWTIMILSMIGSLCLSIVYAVARLVNKPVLTRLAYIFASVFVLVLLANLLFSIDGNPTSLGDITISTLVIDILYVSMLFSSFPKEEKAPEVSE